MELNLVVTWREAVVLLALVALVYLAGVLLGMIRGRSNHEKPSNPDAGFSRMRTEIETLRLRVDAIRRIYRIRITRRVPRPTPFSLGATPYQAGSVCGRGGRAPGLVQGGGRPDRRAAWGRPTVVILQPQPQAYPTLAVLPYPDANEKPKVLSCLPVCARSCSSCLY